MPVAPLKVKPQVDVDQSRRARRAERFRARHLLRELSTLKRVRTCGVTSVRPGGVVSVRVQGVGADRRAGFGGLSTCGSVWACPCCATKVLTHRQGELERALTRWTARGGRVAMLTLTMRHHAHESLVELWDGLSKAWHRVTSGRAWETTQERYGAPMLRKVTRGKREGQVVEENRVGWVRVVEVTHGENGWHVHVHAALLLPGSTTARDVDDLGCLLFQRWKSALVDQGLQAPRARQGGLDAKLWDGKSGVLSDYFTKNEYAADPGKAAVELTRSDLKTAKSGNRTPFAILRDVVDGVVVEGPDDYLRNVALWREWEKGSVRRRQMTWSTGLRDHLLPNEDELTDEEVADLDLGGDDLVNITRTGWREVVKHRLESKLLNLAEDDDTGDALCMFLVEHGIEWARPAPVVYGCALPPDE